MLFWISAVVRAAPYVLASLTYLRKLLDPPAPATLPVSPPYTPPFLGGQCNILYSVDTFNGNGQPAQEDIIVRGAIRGIVQQGNSYFLLAADPPSQQLINLPLGFGFPYLVATPLNGQLDNCGDLPNPIPPPPIPPDGIADNQSPDIFNNSTTVVVGSPLSTQLSIGGAISNIRGAIAAAVAAANAAGTALAAIGAVANAIGAIGDAVGKIAEVLDKLEEREREKEKEEEDKKDVLRYEFGSISRDGFLRFYPNPNIQKYKAEQLDLIILSIPIGYGKFFGDKSPNFYRFKSLGYIAFVSPTFGIIEYRQIEFSRTSLIIPDDSIGFFYHLGLDGAIAANCFGFYTKRKV